MRRALATHWPEYLMEAAELGAFMVSACLFALLLYHPASPVSGLIAGEFLRRTLMGLAMGLTAIAIIYSRWGKQSGAHMNPAVTLAFLWLGKVAPWDAAFYIGAQFLGGVLAMLLVAWVCGSALADPSVNYVATLPGAAGVAGAFLGEMLISLVLLMVVLRVSSSNRLGRFTGVFAGACVSLFIILEAPVSGMSMNPARSFASAFVPQLWTSLWIYFLAPPVGMLLAVALHQRLNRPVACAKLHHQNTHRCIFCEYQHEKQTARAVENPVSEVPLETL